jgi:Flp pilus assembly protein TadG
MRILKRNTRGQVLVLVALVMFMLVGIASLALDIGRAYGVKARLNAAVDAASYEATRAITQGSDLTTMSQKATDVATAFFNANYPSTGYLGATPNAPTVTPVHDPVTGLWTVTVQATANMPTILAGVVGWPQLNVGAVSASQRRSLDMVLVLDTSYSLHLVFDQVKQRSEEYVDMFSEMDDRVGVVAFSTGAQPIVSICGVVNPPRYVPQSPPTGLTCARGFVKGSVSPQSGVKGAIDTLSVNLTTNSEEGMKKALDQLNSLDAGWRSSTRVIVFFSDGAPNTFSSRITLTGGGTKDGNLYSQIGAGEKAQTIFDPDLVNDTIRTDNTYNIRAPLTTSGTDLSGAVALASYNNKRSFLRGNSDEDVQCDANKAARNMAENVANMARSQGIIVFTLGLGEQLDVDHLEELNCGFSSAVENGANILKRMANTKDSDTHNPSQPTGIYCEAKTIDDLKPCYAKIASAILRITR